MQIMIVEAKPNFKLNSLPKNLVKRRIFKFVNVTIFKLLMNILLIGDLILLCLHYDGASADFYFYMELANHILNIMFLSELALKLYAYGGEGFMYFEWGNFELINTLTMLLDLFEYFILRSYYNDFIIQRFIKGLRVVKMIRLLKLLNKINNIKRLLNTLKLSLPMLFNIFGVLMLVYVVFVLFGCNYFRVVKSGKIIDEYINFSDFAHGMMTLYKVSTADGWENIMFDITKKYCKHFIYKIINLLKGGLIYISLYFTLLRAFC